MYEKEIYNFWQRYANTTVSDPFIRNKEISDIQYGYGQIKLTTTEKELEKFVIKLMKNEAEFKVIDYFEEGSKEHDIFRYGIDNILKPV